MAARQRRTRGRGRTALETGALFVFLLAFWVVLSGSLGPQDLLIGALCAGAVTLVTPDRFLAIGRDPEGFGLRLGRISPWGVIRYGLWLLWEIVQANVQVAWLVLHPRMPVEPKLLRFRVGFRNRIPQVVLAHSITLTPGTVTVDLDDRGEYLVHALVPDFAGPLLEADVQNGIARAFGEDEEEPPRVEWFESVRRTGQVVGLAAEDGGPGEGDAGVRDQR